MSNIIKIGRIKIMSGHKNNSEFLLCSDIIVIRPIKIISEHNKNCTASRFTF
jgi:hypothetical protein